MRAMILAAGRGERMRPLTDHRPKPLLQVGGKPLIVWHLEALAEAGFRDVVINHAHLGALIEEALGDGGRWGLNIGYSPEKPALETAGGIARALPMLGAAPFLVVNGDVFCDFPLARAPAIGARMQREHLLAWCVLVPNPPQHPQGDFVLEDERLVDDTVDSDDTAAHAALATARADVPFSLNRRGPASRLTFSGIGVYAPELFSEVDPNAPAKLAPLLRDAARKRGCGAERHDGTWVDVGTPERLAALDAQLQAR